MHIIKSAFSNTRNGEGLALPASCMASGLSKLVILLVFLVFSPFLLAADSHLTDKPPEAVKPFNTARQLFATGDYKAAYDKFFELFKENPGNADVNFYLGRSAFEAGLYEQAIMAFERVLIIDPGALRVKLEIARSHLALGSFEVAKQLFLEILETEPPEPVKNNINAFLAAIDRSEQRHWFSGLLNIGIGYDDNVAAAPIESTITILGDLPFTAEEAEDDLVYSGTAVFNYAYRPQTSPYSWNASLVTYNALYDEREDLDINYFGVKTGPAWQQSKYSLDLQVLFDHLLQDGEEYLNSYGAELTGAYLFTPSYLSNLKLSWEDKNFRKSLNEKDGDNTEIRNDHFYNLGSGTISLALKGARESAESDENSYDRWSIQLGYQHKLSWQMLISLNAERESTRYEDKDPSFQKLRDDDINRYTFALSKQLWFSGERQQTLSVYANYIRTDAESTIPLYEYEKKAVNLGLNWTF